MYNSFISMAALKENAFRIFDPFAYRLVHEIRFVPIGLTEAAPLARLFPIVWTPNLVGDLRPVVVLRLQVGTRDGALGQQTGLRLLPQLLQAYPFRLRDLESGDVEIGLEQIMPENERDSGSYVYDPSGELLPGAKLKMTALNQFLEGQPILQDLTNRLQAHAVFEPVRLPDAYAIQLPLPDMSAALETFDLKMVLDGMPDAYVQPAIAFLVAQRMSLYRMHRLLGTAMVSDG